MSTSSLPDTSDKDNCQHPPAGIHHWVGALEEKLQAGLHLPGRVCNVGVVSKANHYRKKAHMSRTTSPAKTITVNFIELQLVETQNGFDYYAIFNSLKNNGKGAWEKDQWVRVPEGATDRQVEDALYRGDLVQGL